MLATLSGSRAADCHQVPRNPQDCATFESSPASDEGLLVPRRHKPGGRAFLDGNFARRKLPLAASEYCIWDTELAGLGLRGRPTGRYLWIGVEKGPR